MWVVLYSDIGWNSFLNDMDIIALSSSRLIAFTMFFFIRLKLMQLKLHVNIYFSRGLNKTCFSGAPPAL